VKKAGILYHPKLEEAFALAREFSRLLEKQGVASWLCSAWEEEEARPQVPGSDLLLSLGGDGTLLRVVRIAVPHPVPVLGVNLGRLGFMAELGAEEARKRLPALLRGEGRIEERAMLEARLPDGKAGFALNEVAVARGGVCRAVCINAWVDGEPLGTYRADGLIVATATGSTAYALSAGGPILYPQSQDLLLIPISPHFCRSAPFVLPPESRVALEVHTDHQAMVSLDGQRETALQSGERVEVRGSQHRARFLRTQPPGLFYRRVMDRLTGKG
jgi:NAD+ kinase